MKYVIILLAVLFVAGCVTVIETALVYSAWKDKPAVEQEELDYLEIEK